MPGAYESTFVFAMLTPESGAGTVGDNTVGEGGASSSVPVLEYARFNARPARLVEN